MFRYNCFVLCVMCPYSFHKSFIVANYKWPGNFITLPCKRLIVPITLLFASMKVLMGRMRCLLDTIKILTVLIKVVFVKISVAARPKRTLIVPIRRLIVLIRRLIVPTRSLVGIKTSLIELISVLSESKCVTAIQHKKFNGYRTDITLCDRFWLTEYRLCSPSNYTPHADYRHSAGGASLYYISIGILHRRLTVKKTMDILNRFINSKN